MSKLSAAGVGFGLAALALAARGAIPHNDPGLTAQVASLAASVGRLQQERPAERVVEYHTTREVVAAAAASGSVATSEGAEAADGAPPGPDEFDRDDMRDYTNGRGPHPIERRFERERADRTADVAGRQHALEAALRDAIEGLDADVHSAECRSSTCRIDATFGTPAGAEALMTRMFTPTAEGDPQVEHGGVFAPVHESVGDRHHTVLYVVKKRSEG